MMLGQLSAARELQDDALENAELAANGYVTCSVLTMMGSLALQRGDHDGALRAGERSVALVQAAEGGRIPTMARVRLATTRRELGGSAAEMAELVASAGGGNFPASLRPGERSGPKLSRARNSLPAAGTRQRYALRSPRAPPRRMDFR